MGDFRLKIDCVILLDTISLSLAWWVRVNVLRGKKRCIKALFHLPLLGFYDTAAVLRVTAL